MSRCIDGGLARIRQVLIATNDVLLVERDTPAAINATTSSSSAPTTSRIGVTWRDWRTIVGFVEGPDASVALQERIAGGGDDCKYGGGCCGAVKDLMFPLGTVAADTPASTTTPLAPTPAGSKSRFWRWEIDATFYG